MDERQKTRIVISHDASDIAMGFASQADHDAYDFEASLEKYEELLIHELQEAFPDADIEIDRDRRGVFVDGEQTGDDADTVNTVISDVFGSFDWLVAHGQRYTVADVKHAYFAHQVELQAEAEGVSPEQQATYGVEAYDPETNEIDPQATRFYRAEAVSNLHWGQKILQQAKLVISSRQQTRGVSLRSEVAPTIIVPAGHLGTAEAYRQVTLVDDIAYVTPLEAAERTGTAESTWRNKAAAGQIPGAIKKGKQWLLPVSVLRSQGVEV